MRKREKCTFLPCCVIWIKIPGYCDNLQHEVIAPLSNHVHHLPVANFHYILIINLHRKEGVIQTKMQQIFALSFL